MRSSTFSFKRSKPTRLWRNVLLKGVVLSIMLLSGLEFSYRYAGHQGSVVDSETLWAIERSKVYVRDGKETVVLVGASRIMLGFSLRTFEAAYPLTMLSTLQ